MATSTPSTGLSAYIFECCCGERFSSVAAASVCKKCRHYSVWGYTKYVVNTVTEEVMYGELPSDEEYAKAEAAATQRWEAEAKEFAEWQAAQHSEYVRYQQEQAAAEEAAAILEAEEEEDRLWEEQERLSR